MTGPTKPIGITDLKEAMKAMDSWKLTASKMIMNKADYDDIIAFSQFECPGCGVSFSRDVGHPENGCDLGDIYNIMEL